MCQPCSILNSKPTVKSCPGVIVEFSEISSSVPCGMCVDCAEDPAPENSKSIDSVKLATAGEIIPPAICGRRHTTSIRNRAPVILTTFRRTIMIEQHYWTTSVTISVCTSFPDAPVNERLYVPGNVVPVVPVATTLPLPHPETSPVMPVSSMTSNIALAHLRLLKPSASACLRVQR